MREGGREGRREGGREGGKEGGRKGERTGAPTHPPTAHPHTHTPTQLHPHTYTHLWFPGWLHILQELLKADQSVCKDPECFRCMLVVHQDDGDVVDVTEIIQLRGKIHISRDEDHSGRGRVGVRKPT